MAVKNVNSRSRGAGLKGANNSTAALPGGRSASIAGRKTTPAGAGSGRAKSGVIPVGKTGASVSTHGGNPSGVGARRVSGGKTGGGAKPSAAAQNTAYKGIGLR